MIFGTDNLSGVPDAELQSLDPPVILPDGREFKTWEKPLKFTRTYYVGKNHPEASDKNPGTKELPFKTIDRAAQILQPAADALREREAVQMLRRIGFQPGQLNARMHFYYAVHFSEMGDLEKGVRVQADVELDGPAFAGEPCLASHKLPMKVNLVKKP